MEDIPAENLAPSAHLRLAERVLSTALGHPVRLGAGQSPGGGSGRARVLRCPVLEGPGHALASVIVKTVNIGPQETYDPDAVRGPSVRLFNEWASLQFLTTLAGGDPLVPRFYGGDRDAGLIVMEDLGTGNSLAQSLMGSDRAEAEAALEAYFRSLGRLNAMTWGHEEAYRRIRDGLGPRESRVQSDLTRHPEVLRRHFATLCDAVGVTPVPDVDDDLVQAARFRAEPGPFLAFSQGDTCPDNCIQDGAWMRFFDFEWGCFSNALNDGARARSAFPTCWCVNRLPDETIQRVESVYRAELVKGCPAAAEDGLFFQELVRACAYWALFTFEFYRDVWNTDKTWGISTERQRAILRFELLAQASETYGCLKALGEVARTFAVRLQALWPETEPMPCYPPFR